MRWLSGTTNTAAWRKVIAIVVIWRDLHALPEGEADKAHKDNQDEKRDNPIRHSLIFCRLSWRPQFYRAERNAIASTTSHPTMTKEATAPAVILAFSFAV